MIKEKKSKKKDFMTDYIRAAKSLVERAFNTKLNEQQFEELKKFIKFSDNTVNTREVKFVNSYNKHERDIKLYDMLNFILNNQPILTGNGTLFKPEFAGGKNISGTFIEYLLNVRSVYKKKKLSFIEEKSEWVKKKLEAQRQEKVKGVRKEVYKVDPKVNKQFNTEIKRCEDGENLFDLNQQVIKVLTNAYYGAIGMKSFIFHDKNCAPAVTSVGASAITSIVQKFEGTIGDHWGFKYTSDVIDFIDDIVNKEKVYELDFAMEITEEMVYNRLIGKINEKPNEDICKLIRQKIKLVGTQEILDRLYYVNNFYEFIKEPQIIDLVKEIFKTEILSGNISDVEKNPDKDFVENINTFANLVMDYCYIPKSYEDRRNFCDNTYKRVVLVVDTDSSFVYTGPFVKYFEGQFKKKDEEWEPSKYITLANIMIFMVCHLSKAIVTDFCIRINIEEQRRHWMDLKNEFLFKRIMLTRNKKNYAGSLILQEGKIIYPPKFDMKGLSIKKVTVNKYTRKYFSDILRKDILESKKIELKEIMYKFIDYEKQVRLSLNSGNIDFCLPMRYGNIDNYKFPFREEVVRGVIIWNECYKDNKILILSNVNSIKLKAKTIEEFDEIVKDNNFSKEETKLLEKLREFIFGNENLKAYGLGVISLPKEVKEIPKWIIPFIDNVAMVDNNVRNALILLESLGVQVVTTQNVNRMSNIVSF